MTDFPKGPEYCFHYSEFASKQPRLLALVVQGRLSCTSPTHWCDAKTPIFLPLGAPSIDISCTFPDCPLNATQPPETRQKFHTDKD